MTMIDDAALLQRYVSERSEASFTQLVQRHIDLVFSVALRELGGNRARAQDVTQTVFTALARKAPQLQHRATLAGWLHVSTHHAAAELMRAEQRRQKREEEAASMNHETLPDVETHPGWERLEPLLNGVVQELSAVDRDAVLLRFFQKRSFAEIGAALRLSEDAAQKRVDRALDKLRARLTKRGITSTAGALAVLLEGQAVAAAPAGLVAGISQTALATGGAGGGLALVFMSMSKIQIGIFAAIVAAGVGTAVFQHRANARLQDELEGFRIENRQIATLRAANATTAAKIAQLEREQASAEQLRREIAALKAAAATRPAPPANPSPAPASTMHKLESLRNAGNATPAAALESLIWAKENLDLATLGGLFALDPDAKEKLAALFPGVPEAERAKHGIATPEQLLAFVFAGLAKQFAGFQIASTREIDADNIVVRAVLPRPDSGNEQREFAFRRSSEGWQWVVPRALVDEIPQALSQRQPVKEGSK
jgi:RNA polymerase sigma factor (sigma-70 family)